MKDPAFLFYSSDFLTGTMTMTDDQVGKYIRLLCLQHQKGILSENDMIFICKTPDVEILSKFIKTDAGYFNKRLKYEAEKRSNYCKSRGLNKKGKKVIPESYDKHMENENEDVIINKKGTKNFVKPTVDEITSYCRERKNNINPVKFFNHYESNGWMVGKSKMKNWKAAVRTWEGNNLDIQTPVVKRDNALNNLYR